LEFSFLEDGDTVMGSIRNVLHVNLRRLSGLLTLSLCTMAAGQTGTLGNVQAGGSLKYSTISIHAIDSAGVPFRGVGITPDETELVMSLHELVAYAYGDRPDFVFEGPKWGTSEIFHIIAKVDESDIPQFKDLSYQQRSPLLREVLESRFGLKIHHESKIINALDLVITKGGLGPNFHVHLPRGPGFSLGFAGENFSGTAVDMKMFIRALSGAISARVDRPLIDKTGLADKYDFLLRWKSDVSPGSSTNQTVANSLPDIYTALQEQLGLKLQPAREQIDAIVIDAATMPSEN
jgi:uncharacterized protein (TIGR03435 family)